jgi:hypothetical protein
MRSIWWKLGLLVAAFACVGIFFYDDMYVFFDAQDPSRKNVYIYPGCIGLKDPAWGLLKNSLEQEGYSLILTNSFKRMKNPYAIISFEVKVANLNNISKNKHVDPVLVIMEPPAVMPISYVKEYHEPFSKIYTWHDDLVDNKRYFKNFYSVFLPMKEPLVAFEKKKFAVLINANKKSSVPNELYSERKKVIDFYQQHYPSEFDLYGRGWEKNALSVYKGPVDDKIACLSQYKFCICYENSSDQPGYVTEKIFDSFAAGIVPLYWGAPNITDYVPENCFIDRRHFQDDEAVYRFMNNMSKETYEGYIANIRAFLVSDKAQLFSGDTFVSLCLKIVKSRAEHYLH